MRLIFNETCHDVYLDLGIDYLTLHSASRGQSAGSGGNLEDSRDYVYSSQN